MGTSLSVALFCLIQVECIAKFTGGWFGPIPRQNASHGACAHGVPVSFDQGNTAALGPGVAVQNEYLILVRKILRRVTADKSGSSGDEHVSHMAASPDFSGSFIPERHFLLLSFLLGHKPQVLQNP